MHKQPPSGSSGDDDRIRELLSLSEKQTLALPDDLRERVRTRLRAETIATSSPATASAAPSAPAARLRRVAWVLSATAGLACVVLAMLYFARPTESFAQVAEEMRGKPWVHMQATDPMGNRREVWLSFPRKIAAIRSGDYVRYADHRAGVQVEQLPGKSRLARVPILEQETFASLDAVFQAIFRGDIKVGDHFAEDRIVDQQHRMVEADGRKWTEYELTLKRGEQMAKAVIRVEGETHLPERLTISAGQEQLSYTFDYPEEGPADIYALGVSRELPIDDRIPADDAARILKTVDANRAAFDDFFAVIDTGKDFMVRLLWKKGPKWRMEHLTVEEPKEFPNDPPGKEWFQEQLRHRHAQPAVVCDGVNVFRYEDAGQWKAAHHVAPGQEEFSAQATVDSSVSMLPLVAYPLMQASAQFTLSVDPQGTNGPPGSVRLELRATSDVNPRAYRHLEYWLDPTRGYVLLKSRISDCPAVDNDPASMPSQKEIVHEFEELRQTPRGIWYPTRVVQKRQSVRTNSDGTQEVKDRTMRFLVDFHAEMKDELFTPAVKGME